MGITNPLKWKRALVNRRKTKDPWGHTNSGLFTLPVELRALIYEMVFAGAKQIHIQSESDWRAYGIPCADSVPHNERRVCVCAMGLKLVSGNTSRSVYRSVRPGIGLVALMLTCRLMYMDMVDLVYKRSTFLFTTPFALMSFAVRLSSRVLQTIASVHIDGRFGSHPFDDALEKYLANVPHEFLLRRKFFEPHQSQDRNAWKTVCEVLNQMQGLKKLKISLGARSFQSSLKQVEDRCGLLGEVHGTERPIIEPLGELADMLGDEVNFEVNVDWPQKEGEEWTYGRFVLKRIVPREYYL